MKKVKNNWVLLILTPIVIVFGRDIKVKDEVVKRQMQTDIDSVIQYPISVKNIYKEEYFKIEPDEKKYFNEGGHQILSMEIEYKYTPLFIKLESPGALTDEDQYLEPNMYEYYPPLIFKTNKELNSVSVLSGVKKKNMSIMLGGNPYPCYIEGDSLVIKNK